MSESVTGEPSPKRQCTINMSNEEKQLTIGTHNGTFHCDEVLACYMLQLLPKYKNARIVRTREQSKLDECSIVVDVGGVYDPSVHRYDHHQRSFNECMNSVRPEKKWTTKLSSAGLVYCHFGEDIIRSLLDGIDIDDSVLTIIYNKVYENFVEEIDGIDNGIDQYEGGSPRYSISTNLSARVGKLNPSWNEKDADETKCFNKALEMVGAEFVERINGFLHVWLPARTIVESSLKKCKEIDDSGQIMKLEQYCPWKEHLLNLEEEHGISSDKGVKYVLYQDSASKWRIQCVPAGKHTFENRLSIKSEWRGLRGEELSKISGIPKCVFVHASGFIGGNETYEGVLEMARACINGGT